ncbi:MAG: HEPN domain-containing protein [Treponema sp.]|jgi:HEPN domain-containing protein|nr:HEPN domain-containing protein [Treponema sp.]
MGIDDAKEWIMIADTDFDSAKLLNESVRKHFEIICYHCSQAVEKYLKGYLVYNDIVPRKTHDLLFLNNICIEKDERFEAITIGCGFLNRFIKDVRYPHKYETNETDVSFSIDSVEKIRNIEPISELRNIVYNENEA